MFYLLGLSFFAAGALYGALAANMENLIVARVIQGLGGGMMTSVSIALISELFPPEKRGGMIGTLGFIQLAANLLSPILGSVITQQLGWHWIFYITLALVLVADVLMALDRTTAPAPAGQPARWTEIDFAGGALFGVFCVLVVSFSDSVSQLGQLQLAGVSLLISALASGLALAWNEARHKDPIIKFAFFQTRVLRQSIVSSLIAGGIMYGLVTLLPLCSAILKRSGFNADDSLLLMIFMVGATLRLLIASRLSPRLDARFPRLIWGLSVLGAGGLYTAVSAGQFVLFNVITGVLGLGLGAILATLLINSQNAVSSQDRTVLSGLVQLGRYLGASVGVTILTGILPEISQITEATQFLGAFGLLVGMYGIGLANELR